MSMQPYRGDQKVVLEARHPDGTLNFEGEQPPSLPCHCGHSPPGEMTFDRVYELYFRENPEGTGSWEYLSEWLKKKGWSIRAKTW
jgi:hypothetical protein